MSSADELQKIAAKIDKLANRPEGTVNDGDEQKMNEYREKVREILAGMSRDDVDKMKPQYEKPQGKGQKIVREELDKRVIVKRTTPEQ